MSETKTLKKGEFYLSGEGAPDDSISIVKINDKTYALRSGTYYGLRQGTIGAIKKAYRVIRVKEEGRGITEVDLERIEKESELVELARLIQAERDWRI